MKISELIKELEKLPQDNEVVVDAMMSNYPIIRITSEARITMLEVKEA